MKIGFIGASRTGTVLARYFKFHGIKISGFYSANDFALTETVKIIKCKPFTDINNLVRASDIIFITTKDLDINKQWAQIDHKLMINKFIFHCSGALASTIFTSKVKNIYKGSIHPLTSIPNKNKDIKLLSDTIFAIEGNKLGLKKIHELLNITQNKSIVLKKTHKIDYHIACVAMTSFYISLYTFANKLIQNALVDKKIYTRELLINLSQVVIDNMKSNLNIKDIVTGPLARQDYETLRQHIGKLNGLDKNFYQVLSENLLKTLIKPKQRKKILKTLEIESDDGYN